MSNNTLQKWAGEQTLVIWNGITSDNQTKNLKIFLIVTKSLNPLQNFRISQMFQGLVFEANLVALGSLNRPYRKFFMC